MSKEEDMQRTLCAEFSPLGVQWDRTAQSWIPQSAFGGWTSLGFGTFYIQQDIDLSGYAMERKTFYPYSSFEQRGGFTSGSFDATLTQQPYVIETTIVSSIPLNETELGLSVGYSPGFTLPSGLAPSGRFGRATIIHGDMRLYTVDSTMSIPGQSNSLRLLERNIFSSLEPTAADKLYCYRLLSIVVGADEGTGVFLPASRVLIPGTIASEPKLEYMMRLKRSYELANQV